MARRIWSYKGSGKSQTYTLMMADDPTKASKPAGVELHATAEEGIRLVIRMVSLLNEDEMQYVRDHCCCERPHMHYGVDHTSVHSDYTKENGVTYDIHCPLCVIHA